jgi:hypothetical protein
MGPVYRLLAALCGVLVCAGVVHGDALPRPVVDYSADVTMRLERGVEGQSLDVTGKVYVARDRERRETTVMGHTSVVISRRDKGVSWILMPAQSMYMENQAKGEDEDPYAAWQAAGVALTKLGRETVNGVATTKFRAEAHGKEGAMETGYIWLSKDNIPVRMVTDGADDEGSSRVTVDYTHIQVGKQDPALFEIPASYRNMTMPGVGMFMGPGQPRGPGSGAPAQGAPSAEEMRRLGEQMRQQMQERMRQVPGR